MYNALHTKQYTRVYIYMMCAHIIIMSGNLFAHNCDISIDNAGSNKILVQGSF